MNRKNYFPEDYSQFGQSTLASIIFQLLKINPVNYVDIGCNHPRFNSNSYYFEVSKGLEGIAIDPQNSLKSSWKEIRPLANFVACCCSSKNSFAELNIPVVVEGWEDQLATLNRSTLRNPLSAQKVIVECKPFAEICVQTPRVSFLSIDVEGHELDVLDGINFEETSFDLICLENCGQRRHKNFLRKYLVNKGYVFFARIFYIDDLFIHASLLDEQFVSSFKQCVSPYCSSVISSGDHIPLHQRPLKSI